MTRVTVSLAALAVGLWATACGGQPDGPKGASGFVENPVMTKGPAGAPVSIVEFSDYE